MPFTDIEQRRAYHREYYRALRRALYRRYRRVGGCGECGTPSGEFARCFKHRLRLARRKREHRARKAENHD